MYLVVQKGDYTNITKVDMTSAIKREQISYEAQQGGRSTTPETDNVAHKPLGSSRENSIIAQCLTKIEYRNCPQPKPIDIMESYRWYLKELD